MNRYFKLFWTFFRLSFIRETLFRANFFGAFGIQICWTGLYILFVSVIFLHTKTIAGWTKADSIVLLGIWFCIDDLVDGIFGVNLKNIPHAVTNGTIDRKLIQPIDSQFLISIEKFQLDRLLAIFLNLFIIAYGISMQEPATQFHGFVLLVPLLIINGVLIVYSLLLLLQSLAFWFARIDNLSALFYSIFQIAKYPFDVFGVIVKSLSLSVIPLGIAVMVPAQALLGRASWLLIGYSFLVSAVFLFFSRKFYQFAVRRYSSVA